MLVSFGDCAVTGNVPAIRNQLGAGNDVNVLQCAYITNAQNNPRLPAGRGHRPELLKRVRPVHEVVPVEVYLPGCPPSGGPDQGCCSSACWRACPPSWRASRSGSAEEGLPMAKRIVIDPVTRIEGHAKISIFLDEAGHVSDAEFHVVEFRGFEKFCEGRPFSEMPGITPRICGICPVSHLLASAKAGDAIMAVAIPPAADKLRRLMNLGQIVQSHALSFFHLSAPDFILGWDAPPATRNVFGLIAADPDLARAGIRLRQFGQEIIEVAGREEDPSRLGRAGRRPQRASPRRVAPGSGSGCPRPSRRPRPPSASSLRRWSPTARRPSSSAISRRSSWAWWRRTGLGAPRRPAAVHRQHRQRDRGPGRARALPGVHRASPCRRPPT